MSDASSYTAQQAGDPATPAHVLADIAAQRPDLRPAVARNPAAYPGLLEWLAGLGDPSIDVALWSRPNAASYGAPGTPAAPVGPGPAPMAAPEGQTSTLGGQEAPAAPAAAEPSAAPVPPYGAPAGQVPPYGAPAGQAPPYGAPAGQAPPYGAPGAPATAYGAPGAGAQHPGYGPNLGYAAPGQALGAGYPPVKKKSNKVVWIVLAAVLALVALVVVALIVLRGVFQAAAPVEIGSDPELDALYEACAAEDWEACDELFFSSPMDSEYEEFGRTCGGRTDGAATCVDAMAEGDGTSGDGQTYGDDPALDALWDACEAGDGASCDQLFFDSPIDSEYEEFGRTCGGRGAGIVSCADELGGEGTTEEGGTTEGEVSPDAQTYGDDPVLDALWDACEAGDEASCDQLFFESPFGSEYEEFGRTCAGRSDGAAFCDQG